MKNKVLIGAFVMLLLGSGCKNESAEPLSTQTETIVQEEFSGVPVAFELGAEVLPIIEEVEFDSPAEDLTRSLKYKVETVGGKPQAKLQQLEEGKPLYSLCVIRPKVGATDATTYYVKLTWQKKKGLNYFFVKEKDVKTVTGAKLTLDRTKAWQICGIFTYTAANVRNHEVAFNPNANATTALTHGTDQVVKDVPLYFDWTDLKVDASGNGFLFNDKGTNPASIKVKPLGVMLRVSFTNHLAFNMAIKNFRLKSNGLVLGSGTLGWKPSLGVKPSSYTLPQAYFSDSTEGEETTYTVNFQVPAGKTYDKFFLVWVFPKDLRGATTEKKYTKVMVSAKRLDGTTEKTYPIMTSLYGFWSTTNDLKVGKRHHLPVTLYRPKMALEYLSDGYAQGPTSTSFNVSTGWWPTAYQYSRYSAPSGYRKLKFNDVRGIMTTSQRVKFSLRTTYEETFSPVGEQAKNIAHIGGVPIDRPYKFTYKNGDPSIFALRFDDGEGPGKRLHYSAYEYEAGNPGQIKAVYLGPNFKGTIADVNAAFINSHSEGNTYDVVKKVFAKASSYATGGRLVRKHANLMVTHMVPYSLNYTVFYSDYSDDGTRVLGYGDNMQRNQDERRAPVVLMETGHGVSNK